MENTTEIVASYRKLGSPDAERMIYEKFLGYSIVIANSRLPKSLRHIVDTEDIMQSALRSSFAWLKSAGEDQVISGDLFRAIIAKITANKAIETYRWHTRKKRDFRRNGKPTLEELVIEDQSRHQTAQEAADIIETFIQTLSAKQQANARMFMQYGKSPAELSVATGLAKRSLEVQHAKLKVSLRYFLKNEGLLEE